MQGIDLSDRLERYLDLTTAQMKMTAGNMANVDTPVYKTQGFDFAIEFARASGMEGSQMNNVRMGVAFLRGQNEGMMKAIHLEDK